MTEALRTRRLCLSNVELAAFAGRKTAIALVPELQTTPLGRIRRLLQSRQTLLLGWLQGLARWGVPPLVRAGAVLIEVAANGHPLSVINQRTLDAAIRWPSVSPEELGALDPLHYRPDGSYPVTAVAQWTSMIMRHQSIEAAVMFTLTGAKAILTAQGCAPATLLSRCADELGEWALSSKSPQLTPLDEDFAIQTAGHWRAFSHG